MNTIAPVKTAAPFYVGAGGFKEASYARNAWLVEVPQGATPADLSKPEFWVHVASQLKAWDRIEAHAVDGTWFAELVVTSVKPRVNDTPGAVRVSMLRSVDLVSKPVQAETAAPAAEFDDSLPAGYVVSWGGPAQKWRVLRASDNEIMQKDLDKAEAYEWARTNLRPQA